MIVATGAMKQRMIDDITGVAEFAAARATVRARGMAIEMGSAVVSTASADTSTTAGDSEKCSDSSTEGAGASKVDGA